MDEQEKQEYLEEYQEAKKKGLPFFPDILFKDAVIALLIFLILVGLSYFIGAPLEERANPADTTYNPQPEWYFMFLFQLLKYFPGKLEVLGVVVIPTVAILIMLILPLLDRSPKRYFTHRPVIIGITVIIVVGMGLLTFLSIREAPPPVEVAGGDQTAALYIKNCAGCHGPTIDVAEGTNLHEVIAQGGHEGMPAWNADLTSDQIDALVGFIVSPGGSQLYVDQCSQCHEITDLVSADPIGLRNALIQGQAFTPHADVDIPNWSEDLSEAERTALLNFLVAPDGQRLYTVDCSPCHGTSIAYAGSEEDLRTIISQGGLHLDMPPWREKLSSDQLDVLARYVVNPGEASEGEDLFIANCASCHGERVPIVQDFESARSIIAEGGPHQTMPVWGDVLTDEQMDALVSYTFDAAQGTSLELGQELFASNCSSCHGDFGEGGANPARAGDIIAPISTAEYLKTRDDATLRAIIAQGQPNFGMSPFSSSFGGPLDDDQIDELVAYIRAWEANPPVELPPEIAAREVSADGVQIYSELCAQCHAEDGSGTNIGPSLVDDRFNRTFDTDEKIFDSINLGHSATAMIAWGEVLTSDQIQQLVEFIRSLQPEEVAGTPVSFSEDVLPIFQAKCNMCHGSLGGWSGETYDSVVNSGVHKPVVIPGNSQESLLAQKLLGTHTTGNIMPPGGKLPEGEIQTIIDWIESGALDN